MSLHDRGWFQLAPCGLVATTPGGDVVEANDTFLAWTARAREDVVGRPFASLLDGGSRIFYETRHTPLMHLVGAVEEVALTLVAADGTPLPTLVNAVRDDETGLVRMAIFKATERAQYERELLAARRTAETSEQRVRVLQDVSSSFDVSATDDEVAESFAAAARDAFAAREAAVYLREDDGELVLRGGTNPLAGKVAPIPSLRNTPEVTVVNADDIDDVHPELATAMRAERLSSITVTPLLAEGRRLGNLACFFARRTDFDAQYFELQQALGRQASQTLTRVRLQRRLAFLALHDQLTGVANRQLLQLSLDDEIEASTASREPLAVLFLDVDDFKSINDAFGHASGDMVLLEIATRLTASVRTGDLVGRIGGDEFVAICPGADALAAEAIAERILSVTRAPITVAGGVVSASVSLGISLYLPGIDERPDAQQLLVRADAAMYSSKRAGKNRLTLAAVD